MAAEVSRPLLTPQQTFQPPTSPSPPSHLSPQGVHPTLDPLDDKPLLSFTLRTITLLRLVVFVLTLAVIIDGTRHARPAGIFFLIILYILMLWSFFLTLGGFLSKKKSCTAGNVPRMSFQLGDFAWSCGGRTEEGRGGVLGLGAVGGDRKRELMKKRLRKSVVDVVFGIFVMVIAGCGDIVWWDNYWRYYGEISARNVLCFIVGGFEFAIAFLSLVWFFHGVKIVVYNEEEEDYEYRIRLPETRTGKSVSMTGAA